MQVLLVLSTCLSLRFLLSHKYNAGELNYVSGVNSIEERHLKLTL